MIKMLTLKEWWDYAIEARMAKYWAAEEMADDILFVPENSHYLNSILINLFHSLVQILKKEWFRK